MTLRLPRRRGLASGGNRCAKLETPAFYLVRWIFVLPGLPLVLVGIEYVARRAPHAVLGVTAVLFAVLARLPARFPESTG